jgi:hypothetical protein
MLKRYAAGLAVLLIALLGASCAPQFTPPPTGVPVTVIVTVVLTPTPVPATLAPLVVEATATQPPASPTATTQPLTSATVPPGVTLVPSATPVSMTPASVLASPTPCPSTIGVGGDFGRAYTTAKLQQELGCPTSEIRSLKTSYESFEHGFMFWREDTKHAYVLYGVDNTWQEFTDTYVDGQPEYSCPNASTPSTSPPTPKRGFGKVWCTQPDVRSRLGKALTDEIGNTRPLQDFQNGSMLLIPDYVGIPLVLYTNSGHWQQVK